LDALNAAIKAARQLPARTHAIEVLLKNAVALHALRAALQEERWSDAESILHDPDAWVSNVSHFEVQQTEKLLADHAAMMRVRAELQRGIANFDKKLLMIHLAEAQKLQIPARAKFSRFAAQVALILANASQLASSMEAIDERCHTAKAQHDLEGLELAIREAQAMEYSGLKVKEAAELVGMLKTIDADVKSALRSGRAHEWNYGYPLLDGVTVDKLEAVLHASFTNSVYRSWPCFSATVDEARVTLDTRAALLFGNWSRLEALIEKAALHHIESEELAAVAKGVGFRQKASTINAQLTALLKPVDWELMEIGAAVASLINDLNRALAVAEVECRWNTESRQLIEKATLIRDLWMARQSSDWPRLASIVQEAHAKNFFHTDVEIASEDLQTRQTVAGQVQVLRLAVEAKDEDTLRHTLHTIDFGSVSSRGRMLWISIPSAQETLEVARETLSDLTSMRLRMQDAAALGLVEEIQLLLSRSPDTPVAQDARKLCDEIFKVSTLLTDALAHGAQQGWDCDSIDFAALSVAVDRGLLLEVNSAAGKTLLNRAVLTLELRQALKSAQWEATESIVDAAERQNARSPELQSAAAHVAYRADVIKCSQYGISLLLQPCY
jgi:hypothetical protein